MATITTTDNPRKPYLARVFKPKQRQRHFATRPEAEAWAAEVEGGEGSELFKDYALRWNEQTGRNKTPQTVQKWDRLLHLHVFPVFGDIPLDRITHEMVKDFLLGSGLSPSTSDMCRQVLGAIFKESVEDGRIPKSPVKKIKTPYSSDQRAEIVPISYHQLEVIEGVLKPEWKLALWLMLGCGLRLGEALAVRADCVREGGTVLRVHEQVISNRRLSDPAIGPLKHRKVGDYRDLPLSRWVRERIEAHIAEFGTTGASSPDGASLGYLFGDFANGVNTPRAFTLRFDRGKAKAGVPDMHCHQLRHRYASTMISAGVPIDSVSKYLGHRSVVITSTLYSHLMRSTAVQAREASEQAMAAFKQG